MTADNIRWGQAIEVALGGPIDDDGVAHGPLLRGDAETLSSSGLIKAVSTAAFSASLVNVITDAGF
ncbi:MAG: hypothetical protein LBV00_06555 [Propionibacteriaceae bacterium]|nr:hypothetical protein [Propionibacteriaceae bacterium]